MSEAEVRAAYTELTYYSREQDTKIRDLRKVNEELVARVSKQETIIDALISKIKTLGEKR